MLNECKKGLSQIASYNNFWQLLPISNFYKVFENKNLKIFDVCSLYSIFILKIILGSQRNVINLSKDVDFEAWVRQGCILSPCSFNLYAEYIMRNAGLEEA